MPADDRQLRRGSDRVRDAVALVLSTLALAAGVVAISVGLLVDGDRLDRAAHEAATRIPLQAVLLDTAPAVPGTGRASTPRPRVPARWVGRDGLQHSGTVPMRGNDTPGSVVRIWVDQQGLLVDPPITTTQAAIAAILAAFAVLMAASLVLALTWLGAQQWIGAYNDARWTQDWARVEPRWTGRTAE